MEGDGQVVQDQTDQNTFRLNPKNEGMSDRQFLAIVHAIRLGNLNEEAMTQAEVNAVLALMGIFERKPRVVKVTREPTANARPAAIRTPLEDKIGDVQAESKSPKPDGTLETVKIVRQRTRRERASDRHDDAILESKEAIQQLVKTQTKRKRTNYSPNGTFGLTLGEFAKINLAKTLVHAHMKKASNSEESTLLTGDWKKSRWLADAHSEYEKAAETTMIGQECLGGLQNLGLPSAWSHSDSESAIDSNTAPTTSTSANAELGNQDLQCDSMNSQATETVKNEQASYSVGVPVERARSILPFEPSEEWLKKFTAAYESNTVKQFMAESTFEYSNQCDKERSNDNVEELQNGTTVRESLVKKLNAFSL